MSPLQNPFVVLSVVAWLAVPAGSLGEAAQKEAMRRHLMPKSKASLTNLGLPAEIPPTGVTPPPADEPPATATTAAATPKHDEAWWRTRMTGARAALDLDQSAATALQTRINALQAEVVNEDNPVKNSKLREELQNKMAELEKKKQQVATDQTAIQAIQEEARRADVPAGWIR